MKCIFKTVELVLLIKYSFLEFCSHIYIWCFFVWKLKYTRWIFIADFSISTIPYRFQPSLRFSLLLPVFYPEKSRHAPDPFHSLLKVETLDIMRLRLLYGVRLQYFGLRGWFYHRNFQFSGTNHPNWQQNHCLNHFELINLNALEL